MRHRYDSIQAGTSRLRIVNSTVERQFRAIETHAADLMLSGLHTFRTRIFGHLLVRLWVLVDPRVCKERRVNINGIIPFQQRIDKEAIC